MIAKSQLTVKERLGGPNRSRPASWTADKWYMFEKVVAFYKSGGTPEATKNLYKELGLVEGRDIALNSLKRYYTVDKQGRICHFADGETKLVL